MVYRHKQFQLDDEQQIVFDEEGNELRIFGNEYLMLAQLCQKKKATHRDLAVLLGFGELYNGDRITKLMEHINAWIKDKVIQLSGEEYSIVGEIQEAKLVYEFDRSSEKAVEEKEEKPKKLLDLSWKMIVMIGIGMAIAVWLIKYILDLF